MRHYRRHHSGSTRAKKILFRILFVLIAAAVITFGAILLGNYLQYKVDRLAQAEMPIEEVAEKPETGEHYDAPTVFGATIDLADYATEEELIAEMGTLAASYDTLLIRITDASGVLYYTSPALCTLNRMPVPTENPLYDLLCSAAAAATVRNLRLCAWLTPNPTAESLSEAAVMDAVLMEELAICGIGEILLAPDTENMTTASAIALRDYLDTCYTRTKGVCPIGVLLPADFYLEPDAARILQSIADAASYLAIHFPTAEGARPVAVYNRISDNITSLLGSFTVYNLRVLLDGTDRVLAAKYKACRDSDIANICFTSAVLPETLDFRNQVSDETDTAESVDIDNPAEHTNPYATTKEETTAVTEAPPPPPETTPSETEEDGGIPWF